MAIDLADLVPYLRAELSVPGVVAFSSASTNDFVLRLTNAFWEARLNGLFTSYKEVDGSIVPISGTTDLGRDFQQVLILYAAFATILNDLRNAQATFSAQAGPVQYSTARSVTVMKEVLTAMKERLALVTQNISSYSPGVVYAIDALISRTESMYSYGGYVPDTWWVR